MIDIHSHVLPNIDDGARNISESLEMITEAHLCGIDSIICTGHYVSDIYNYTREDRQTLINEIQERLIENNIDVKLYNGAETYLSIDTDVLVEKNIIPTLNSSKYILIEVPMNTKIIYLDDAIGKLLEKGLIPILAHPERYSYMQTELDMYEHLIKKGVLFQSNFGSVIGQYGIKAEKVVRKLLKNDMISFLASDAHRSNSIYTQMDKVLKELGKIISDDKIEQLTTINPEHILKGENIDNKNT